MKKILVVDDEPSLLDVIRMRLSAEGYAVATAVNSAGALEEVRTGGHDLVLLDLRLGDGENGMELMSAIHELDPNLPIIILTAYGTIESAVAAMKNGAYSYVTKPFEHNQLLAQIRNCLHERTLSEEVSKLRSLLQNRRGSNKIIGRSKAMLQVIEKVLQAAQSDANVYIEGESGTGKELIATTLHEQSQRRDGPFVAVNCAAIPETLMESELFGYCKGAFSGATRNKKGFFAQADCGSLFLDEISEISINMQAKLLRAVQEKTFYPLGSTRQEGVDVRIIASSNRNLEEEVRENRFREDLFYRIHVIVIHLPPLRERLEDVPLLVEFFRDKFNRKAKKRIKGLTPAAMERLMTYDWPGNVRELENCIESAVAMTSQDMIDKDFILQTRQLDPLEIKPLKEAKDHFEKIYLVQLIEKAKGNISKAALLSGKYRADLYELFKKHHLSPKDFRTRNK